MAHFLRPTLTITFLWSNFDVAIRSFLLTLTVFLCWEVPSVMFDVTLAMVSSASATLAAAFTDLSVAHPSNRSLEYPASRPGLRYYFFKFLLPSSSFHCLLRNTTAH